MRLIRYLAFLFLSVVISSCATKIVAPVSPQAILNIKSKDLTSPDRDPAATEFRLSCLYDEERVGAPLLAVVKKIKKKAGHWVNHYFVEIKPQNPTVHAANFEVNPSGSGDEDYNEFSLSDLDQQKAGISAVYIQNSFKWASLINTEGSSFARCQIGN